MHFKSVKSQDDDLARMTAPSEGPRARDGRRQFCKHPLLTQVRHVHIPFFALIFE